jgi:hypothetical protein
LTPDAFAKIADQHKIYYTIHLDENLNPCDFNDRVANAYMETYLDKLNTFRNRCEKAIGDADIKICIENSDGYDENSDGYDKEFLIKGLALLLESKVFALTFDIGHNAGIGGGDEEVIMRYKNSSAICTYTMPRVKVITCRVVLETKTVEGLKKSAERVKSRKPTT